MGLVFGRSFYVFIVNWMLYQTVDLHNNGFVHLIAYNYPDLRLFYCHVHSYMPP